MSVFFVSMKMKDDFVCLQTQAPKKVFIHRDETGEFGFTLRHFIKYPPSHSVSDVYNWF